MPDFHDYLEYKNATSGGDSGTPSGGSGCMTPILVGLIILFILSELFK